METGSHKHLFSAYARNSQALNHFKSTLPCKRMGKYLEVENFCNPNLLHVFKLRDGCDSGYNQLGGGAGITYSELPCIV